MSIPTISGQESIYLILMRGSNSCQQYVSSEKAKHHVQICWRRLISLGWWTRMGLVCIVDLISIYALSWRTSRHLGTDATIAQHIQTIVDRGYVIERNEGATKYLVPSTLGIGLVEGYNEIGFDKSLSKPQLRRDVGHCFDCPKNKSLLMFSHQTERAMVQVCERVRTKYEILDQSIEPYKEVYARARLEFEKVISVRIIPV